VTKEDAMAVNESRLPTRQAAFADAAQAERAVAQLQQHGIDEARITVGSGGTAAPGRTAAADREIVDRLAGSWFAGAAIGAIIGATLGGVIGGLVFGVSTSGFWSAIAGGLFAGGGLGALWGMFAGFAGRGSRTGHVDPEQRELPDAVRVIVATKPGEDETVRRILGEQGGAI
jgi:hypothetical protein